MLKTASNLTFEPAGRMRAANLAALTACSDPSVATSTDTVVATTGPCGPVAGSPRLIAPSFGPGPSGPPLPLVQPTTAVLPRPTGTARPCRLDAPGDPKHATSTDVDGDRPRPKSLL